MATADADLTFFRCGFDDATVAWLLELAEACHTPVDQLIPALIRGVKEEAELTGETIHAGIEPRHLHS